MNAPDPATVREIAKAAMGYALRQCRDAAVEAALLAGTTAPVLPREFAELARAVIAEYDRLAATLSWPDEKPQDDGDVRAVVLGAEIATTERITSLLYDLDERTKERDEARELACVSLDILRNVSDEPMRELYGVDDFDEMPAWFTGYGKPGGKR